MSLLHRGAAERYARHGLIAGAVALALACGEPAAPSGPSTFTADVSGAINEHLAGSATASSGADWPRQSVVQVTLPDGGTFSAVVLTADGGASTISLGRSGTTLPVGTYRVGRGGSLTPSMPAGAFFAGYTVRRAGNTLQLFIADSGSVTIAQTGPRVTGTFTLYANTYDVIPMPTPALVGKPITPIESGRSPVTISGSFDAARR